jgi:hypothetical protein
MNQPALLNVAGARLPAAYEAAKLALASCAKVDECQAWADKAAALASYARQADDDALQKHAMRIQARAVRRCGELLKQFDGRGGDQTKKDAAVHFAPSQRHAADEAGISERQAKTAVRVANLPAEAFEAIVESPTPTTVTAIAEMGRKRRGPLTEPAAMPPRPAGFSQATYAIGTVEEFAVFCLANDPEFVAGGVLRHEVAEAQKNVAVIDVWLDRFVVNLRENT